MARIYPVAIPIAASTTFTPRELNREMREIHGEFNGRLDRENIGVGTVDTATQIEIDAIGERYWAASKTTRTLSFSAYDFQGSQFIPDDDGNPWRVELNTPDCALLVEGGLTALGDGLAYVLRVDGEVVDFRPWSQPFPGNSDGTDTGVSVWLKGLALVGAGVHVIDWLATKPRRDTTFNTAIYTVQFQHRSLSIRILKR